MGCSQHHSHLFLSSPYPAPLRAYLSPSPLLGRPSWSKYSGQLATPAMRSGLQLRFPSRGAKYSKAARAGGALQLRPLDVGLLADPRNKLWEAVTEA